MKAAKNIILLLWLVIVASLGNASALTPGASENRVWQKSFATPETRQAEPLQTLGGHQENEGAGYDYAVDSLLAAEDATTLYRVVGPDELSGIQQAGQYTASPGGLEVKYFYPTPEQAANFAANPANAEFGPFTLTSTEVPTSVINSGNTINVAGEGTVITIPNEQLPNLGVPTVHPSIPLPGAP